MRTDPSRGLKQEFLWPALGLLLLLLALSWLFLPANSSQAPGGMQDISLQIPRKGMLKLRLQRQHALQQGILFQSRDPWVKAILREGDQTWPVKLRLKGDWTDHLEGAKWSFRVQLRDSSAYRRMRIFNLQHPGTRDYLDEYFFHLVLRDQGILTPRYDFLRLRINGNMMGVYAIEEHLSKEMLESQHRREGPILAFADEGFWEATWRKERDNSFPMARVPVFEAAHPEAFQYARYLRDTGLAPAHMAALGLMAQYQAGNTPVAELFDLQQVAKQYALTDLFNGHHSLLWYNRRFYYDPIVQRLEPIVTDACADNTLFLHGPFTGYACNGQTDYGPGGGILGTVFFRDSNFVEMYYHHLWAYSDPQWIKMTLERWMPNLEARESYLQREFLAYSFDEGQLHANAQRIRSALEDLRPYSLRWDSVALGEGEWKYRIENDSPLALRIGGHFLDAYDTRGEAPCLEMQGRQRPPVEVAGKKENQLTPLRESGPRFW